MESFVGGGQASSAVATLESLERSLPRSEVTREQKVLTALEDPRRRNMVQTLVKGPLTSRELAKQYGMSQQLAYHHLQKLINAGIVEIRDIDRRGNKEVYFYGLVPEYKNGLTVSVDISPFAQEPTVELKAYKQ